MKQWASLRPAIGMLLFLEFLTWAGLLAGWFVTKSLVPSLTLHRMDFVPLLSLPALMTLVMIGHLRWRQKAVQASPTQAASKGSSGLPHFLPTWKYLLLRLAVGGCLWLGSIQMGSRLQEVESEGVGDDGVGRQQQHDDRGRGWPRLDLAKRTIERLAANASATPGAVVFAGESYIQCPLTTDLNALSLFLETVGPGMVPTQDGRRTGGGSMLEWLRQPKRGLSRGRDLDRRRKP